HIRLENVIAALGGANRAMVLEWADHPSRENRRSYYREAIVTAWVKEVFNAALAWAGKQEDAKSLLPPSLRSLGLSVSGYVDKVGSLPPEVLAAVLSSATKRGVDLDDWITWDYEGRAGLTADQARKVRFSAIHRQAYTDTRKALESIK